MKAKTILGLAVIIAILLSTGLPAKAVNSQQVTVQGTVQSEKNQSGNFTSVKIKGQDKTYDVKLDDTGQEIGEMNGERITATGTLSNQNQLAVQNYHKVGAGND